MLYKKFTFILFLTCFYQFAFAQDITNIIQEGINAVGQDVTNSTIQIDNTIPSSTYDIYVSLSNQGIQSVNSGANLITAIGATINSVTGTVEEPIINVTATSVQFEIIIPRMATCTTYDLLSSGSAVGFTDSAKIGAGGTLFTPVSNYQVTYAALSIPNITDSNNTITPSSVIDRSLRIVQGFPGKLQEFYIEIIDTNGLLAFSNIELRGANTISIPSGQITTLPNTIVVQITSQDILDISIGNGDNLFNLNESLYLDYDFSIDAGCPSGSTIPVRHKVFWGELGNTTSATNCQENSENKLVSFSEELPNLIVSLTSSLPDACIGYGAGSVIDTISLRNNGDADLIDLSFTLIAGLDDFGVFDAGNITYSLDGAAPTTITPTSSTDVTNNKGCFASIPGGLDLKNTAEMLLPINIPAGSTVKIIMQTYSCCPTECVSKYEAHNLSIEDITYTETCGSILSENDKEIEISTLNWGSAVSAPSNFFENDPPQYASIDILEGDLSAFLLDSDATFVMTVNLPGGVDLEDPNNISWSGSINPDLGVISNVTDDGFTMIWDAAALQYKGGIISFPMITDCTEPGGGNLEINLSVIPKAGCGCAIELVCESSVIALGCPGNCQEGADHLSYNFYRQNTGLTDIDNNGCPDTDNDCNGIPGDETPAVASGTVNIRDTRALEGDTIISEVISVIRDIPGGGFRRLAITDDFGDNSNRNRFIPISADVEYIDISTNTSYTAIAPVSTSTGKRQYRMNPTVWGLSNSTHRYEDGDTIKAKISYVLSAYTTNTSIARSVTNKVDVFKAGNYSGTALSCSTFAGLITHVSLSVFSVNKTDVTINGCGEKDIISDIKFSVGKTDDAQFFPYEYRRIGYVDSFAIRILDEYNYTDAAITISRYQYYNEDSIAVTPTQVLPGVGYTDYIFNLNDPINSGIFSDNGGLVFPGDETYTFRLIVNVAPSCDITNNVFQELDPNDEVTFAQAILEQYSTSSRVNIIDVSKEVKSRMSNLVLSSLAPIEPFYSNTIAWDIKVRNNDANGVADNVWAIIETPGNIDPSSVTIHQDNGGILTEFTANANGIFELGNIDTKTTINYKIGAEVLICEYDSIVIYIGERCLAYPNSIAEAKTKCNEEFTVYVEPKNAQATTVITSLANTPSPIDGTLYGSSDITMCSPFPVEIQIVSGQIEPINQVSLNVPSLGSGLQYVAGSGYIWYDRNGDGNLDADGIDNIDDLGANDDERIPFNATQDANLVNANATGNDYLFDIKSLTSGSGLFDWDAGQYLPGVIELPKNIIYIRYEMETTCDIVIGTAISAQVFAQKALCGSDAIGNGELKAGYNLSIAGATAPYTTSSTKISQNEVNSCGDMQAIDFSFTKNVGDPVTSSDSIVVFLPTGLSYDSFISNNGDRAIATSPEIRTVPTGQYLTWATPTTLLDNETIDFSINVLPTSTTCSDFQISMEVQSVTTISCGATTCSASTIVVGKTSEPVTIELPEFEINLNTLDLVAANQYEGTFDLSNISNIDFTDDLVIELYQYDGVREITGSVLGSVASGTVMNGEQKVVNFSFSTTEDLSLGVVAIIPNVSNNCYCGLPDVALRSMGNTPSSVLTPTLPIELISFNVHEENCQINLEWVTAKEDNFSHFEVTRLNTLNAEPTIIGEVEGRYSNGGTYTFNDATELPSGKYYYQLKSIDLDGSFEYSSLASVTIDCGESSILVVPNPVKATQAIKIILTTQYEEEVIQIFDASGKMVQSIVESTIAGQNNEVSVSLDNLAPSIYFIRTSSGLSTKFVVK